MMAARRKRPSITIRDVAAQAGVSLMTVSRVVNGAASVAEATRERVQQTIQKLGFVPDRAARSLRSRRSWWVALAFQKTTSALRGDPSYVMELQDGVIQRCIDAGYHVAIEVLDASNEVAARQLRELVQQLAPDGMLLAPPLSSNARLLEVLQELHIPFVRIAPRNPTGRQPCVAVDDRGGARQMTEYLLSLGHRRIGFVQGPPQHVASAQRLAGHRDALRAGGVAEEPVLIVAGDFTFDGGRRAAAELLGGASAAPTAIFASNDELAAGCLADAHARGLRVPQDLSITGFDDTYVATMLYPPLTTVRQSIREIGRAAAGQLLELLEGKSPPQAVRIPHEVVRRQSAAAPRK
jgi:LacI family transcriptional regulator